MATKPPTRKKWVYLILSHVIQHVAAKNCSSLRKKLLRIPANLLRFSPWPTTIVVASEFTPTKSGLPSNSHIATKNMDKK